MDTFSCPQDCPRLCKASTTENFIFQISDLYPGLTPSERVLAAKDPTATLLAYRLSYKAESLCSTVYITSRTNDESDSCRHFVWAGLMQNEMGTDKARDFLNAHEADPQQPEAERAMDLANNREGILASQKLGEEKRFSEETLLQNFKDALKNGRLVVLKPRVTKEQK